MVHIQSGNELDNLLAYISTLRIDDIDSLQARTSHNSDQSAEIVDEELAMLLFAQEAEGLLNISKEFATGSSSHTRSLLDELTTMEEMARYDHEVALAISEDRPIPPPPVPKNSRPLVVQIVYASSDNDRFVLLIPP